jgi:tetratricopeptide (TPR) repeat protein
LANRPSAAEAQARLGEVLLELGDSEGAERALRAALAADDRKARWHAALGKVFLKRGQAKPALDEARKALKIVANHAAAKLVEANALAAQGDIDLAIVAYESAYGLARTSPEPLVDAARACLNNGRPTTARAFADRATQDFPKWGPAWEITGDVAADAKEKATASAAYKKALAGDGPVDKNAVRRKLARLK